MMQNMVDCINRLNALNPNGTFNYSIAEKMELALPQWISFKQMIDLVSTDEFKNTLFGDIYFKN